MIRDRRMQALIATAAEPITPFLDRVRELAARGISSVLVIGGSGDYLDVTDTVIAMTEYRPSDVTDEARAVAEAHPTGRSSGEEAPLEDPRPRTPASGSIDPRRGRREVSVRTRDRERLEFGTQDIDLRGVPQIVTAGQTRAIGRALVHLAGIAGPGRTVAALLDEIEELVGDGGLDALPGYPTGDLTAFRRFELAAALNRLRTFRVDPARAPV